MRKLYIRIAVRGDCDPERTGVYRCIESKQFALMAVAWAYDGEEAHCTIITKDSAIPDTLKKAFLDPQVRKIAYDAAFVRICLSRALGMTAGHYLPPNQWECVKSLALYAGFPDDERKLIDALGVEMLPHQITLNELLSKLLLEEHPDDPFAETARKHAVSIIICDQVDLLREICEKLEDCQLPESEQVIYALTQRINDRGVQIDCEFAKKALGHIDRWKTEYTELFRKVTGIADPKAADEFRLWLAKHGIETDSVSSESLSKQKFGVDKQARLAIELWRQLNKTGVKKYAAILESVCSDGRLRGLYEYYKARNGRFGNGCVQVDNLPVSRLCQIYHARENVLKGSYEQLKNATPLVPSLVCELLPTAFIPGTQNDLYVLEYEALENCITEWISKESGIVAYSCILEKAIEHVAETGFWMAGGVQLLYEDDLLTVILPTGRELFYREAQYAWNGMFNYCGYDGHHRYLKQKLTAGSLASDIVQALMRDVLASTLVRLENLGSKAVMIFPSGIIIEDKRDTLLQGLVDEMEHIPKPFKGLKLSVRAYGCSKYLVRSREFSTGA